MAKSDGGGAHTGASSVGAPHLVFVHGFLDDPSIWDATVNPGAEPQHRVLAGRGRCRRPGVSQNAAPGWPRGQRSDRLSSAMMATVARVVAAKAALTGAGAVS